MNTPKEKRKILLNALNDFKSADSIDEIWKKLHTNLDVFGISNIYYGFDACKNTENNIIFNSEQFSLVSYRENYLRDRLRPEFLEHDPYYDYALSCTEPLLWSDMNFISSLTPAQHRCVEVDYDHNVIVGVTLPFRFRNGLGRAGCSLNASDLTWVEFDRVWRRHGRTINAIAAAFDIAIRERHNDEIFNLSNKEIECLLWLSNGLQPQQIADKYSKHVKTIEKQIESIRRKLRTTTTTQAVAKAIVCNLVQP